MTKCTSWFPAGIWSEVPPKSKSSGEADKKMAHYHQVRRELLTW
jgi:hypothetical protein